MPNKPELAFITCSDQCAIKDPERQQLARTHAIKNSLQRKRNQLQLTRDNFVDETQSIVRRGKRRCTADSASEDRESGQSVSLASCLVDPFGSIASDISRLRVLSRQTREAGGLNFNLNGPIEFQGLRKVFNAGLEDPCLSSAVSLALAFAANGGIMDRECITYRLETIQHVNQKLANPAQAASEITIGAVLLLAGIEVRLGEPETAQMHLNGTHQLLHLSNERKVSISHTIKRALFWQDLFSSMIARTTRVFSHETFPEIQKHRDSSQSNLCLIPEGFKKRRHILGEQFTELIGDIRALQHLCEGTASCALSDIEMETVDNQQAWIESRLEQLRRRASGHLLRCCIPAAFLCAHGFCTENWGGLPIASRLTSDLLEELQASETWSGWDDHAELLLWLGNIGLAFTADLSIQQEFARICRDSHFTPSAPLSQSWKEIEWSMKQFIWSDAIYRSSCERVWEELRRDSH